MASVHYYLKDAWSELRCEQTKSTNVDEFDTYMESKLQIICSVSINGARPTVGTGKRIEPKYWDNAQEKANTKTYRILGTQLNAFLNDHYNLISKFAEDRENKGERISRDELKFFFSQPIQEEIAKPVEISFQERLDYFLLHHKTRDGYSLRPNTKKKYEGMHEHLLTYAAHIKSQLTLEKFTKEFLQLFRDYLATIVKLSDNTTAKNVKCAKTFIKFYIDLGILKSFVISQVKVIEREGEVIVLPLPEIMRLHTLQMDNDRLSKVKDVFMFMCWTGQRYSDIANFKWTDIVKDEFGDDVWHVSTEKTRDSIKIPLLDYAKDILTKYAGCERPLPVLTNQKTNAALKEMASEAEIGFNVKIIRFYDGVKSEDVFPFHEVVTTHIARKSFITSALMLGVPERIVRDISGHKDEKSFRRYVNFADSYKTRVIRDAFSKRNISQRVNDLKKMYTSSIK